MDFADLDASLSSLTKPLKGPEACFIFFFFFSSFCSFANSDFVTKGWAVLSADEKNASLCAAFFSGLTALSLEEGLADPCTSDFSKVVRKFKLDLSCTPM